MVNVDRRDEALLKIVENNRENRAAKQPSVKRLIWEESEKKSVRTLRFSHGDFSSGIFLWYIFKYP